MGVRPVGQARVADPVDVVAVRRGSAATAARSPSGARPAARASAARAARGSSRTGRAPRPSRSGGIAAARPRSSRTVTAIPLTVSEWPARYFVAEWNAMSAPSASGRWMAGDANVLSTTSSGRSPRAPRWASSRSATASMSMTLRCGFDGVSSQTSRVVAPARRAAPRPDRLARSSQRVVDAAWPGDPLEIAPGAAVHVVAGEDRLAWSDELGDRGRRSGAARERDPVPRRPPARRPPARVARGSGSGCGRTRSRRVGRPTPSCAYVLVW